MNVQIQREELAALEKRLETAKKQLVAAENACGHTWSNPISANIYEKPYTIPGDPAGTGGIDRRGPIHVPAKTTLRWKRQCTKCGKVEYTQSVTEQVTKLPKFH